MRFTSALGLMLAGLAAGCAPGGGNASGNEANAVSAPTVSAALAGGACVLRWDGELANAEAITRRGVAVLERAIAAVGGIANITEENMPVARFEATPDTPYSCFGPALMALKASGFAMAELPAPQHGVGGAGRPAQLGLVNLDETPPGVTLALGAGGRISWNDEPMELAALRSRVSGGGGRVTQFGETRPREEPAPGPPGASGVPEMVEERPPPGAFALAPEPDLSFAEFLAVVQAVFEGGEIATLP